jgi:hypothetical protein
MRARYLVLFSAVAGCAEPLPDRAGGERAVARAIVNRMALQPGERVLLVGDPAQWPELVPHLRDAVLAARAQDLGALSVSATPYPEPTAWTTEAGESGVARLTTLLEEVDAGIMLPGAQPSQPVYGLLQQQLARGRGRTIHFHWSGAYSLDGRPIPVDARVSALYERALLETDYDALARAQAAFEAAARQSVVRVTTPAGTDIRFRIGDRPVTRQDGDASAQRAAQARNLIDREIELPAGAIRVAPLEESVDGVIAFPAGEWAGERVEGLRMRIERGRVVAFEAATGRAAVESELAAAGEAGRWFREFALGFNPLLAIPATDPWIPYYGYGAGAVRLSLGDNTELGGSVGGGYVRWNFFTDTTVTVGDEVLVSDGVLSGAV